METGVVIISHARFFNEALEKVLGAVPGLRVSATNFAFQPSSKPAGVADVILIDASIRQTVRLIRQIRRAHPKAHVVAMGIDAQESVVIGCAEAGVTGFVPPTATVDDLVLAIRAAARGDSTCSPQIAAILVRRLGFLAQSHAGIQRQHTLSAREQEVLNLVGQGYSNKEIADRLVIQLPTVKNHVHNVLRKIGARNRSEAVAHVWVHWPEQYVPLMSSEPRTPTPALSRE